MADKNRYIRIIEEIFSSSYKKGAREVVFSRDDIVKYAHELGISLPKNLGDLVYSFRYRAALPESIRKKAPKGEEWIILPMGIAKYAFVATGLSNILPSPNLSVTKIPNATPGIIAKYALNDEQALLAQLRYNRLIDIFTGITCYSLQNHLRTTVPNMGQVETDELYVGIDRKGVHYVFPVQAKGGKDKLNIVQILQDFALCETKFPDLVCRPIAAQFMDAAVIVLFEFEQGENGISIASEKHYRLVPPEEMTRADLESYRQRVG
ncbi:MAG: endonuclease [Geobacter sp.]|nr:endonuclease [Geobacter sp.]